MQFNAPEVILTIRDIATIYALNDEMEKGLDSHLRNLENDIYVEESERYKISRFEKILGIQSLDTDTLEDRQFRVRTRISERLPYTVRVLEEKLKILCGDKGYTLNIDKEKQVVTVRVALVRKRMLTTVSEMLEEVIPLNMVIDVSLLYNSYSLLKNLTYQELSFFTQKEVRDEILGN